MSETTYTAPTMADKAAKGENPEVDSWKIFRIIKFVKILNKVGVDFAVLGTEETCTGDPARRAGNEFLFQMQAVANIQVLNGYNVKKIVLAQRT